MTPLSRFVSLVFFLLACFALPQQAAAQQTIPPVVEISIDDDASAEEGGTIRFTVTLSAELLEARTFNISYRGISSGSEDAATPATDLGSDRPTTLTIPTGVTEVTFDVPTAQDNLAETTEYFRATLSVPTPFPTDPANTLDLSDARGDGQIRDNDTVAIQIFSQRQVEHQEFRFRITTTGARSEKPIPMTWTVTDGTASVINDLDLSSTSGSITLPASVGNAFSQAFLEIPINNDALVESDETFTVTLSARGAQPPGVVYNSGARATGTITDTLSVFSLSPGATNSLVEGRQYHYTVNLNKPLSQPVNIIWTATDGTATVADDLQAPRTGRVFFPAGSTTGVGFIIRSVDDTEDEADETFTVTLSEDPATPLPNTAIISLDNNSTVTTILDNDEPSATVSIANESVAENVSGGNATFTATLSQAVDSDVTLAVAYTAGTATLADDLGTPLRTTVTITEGNLTGTFTVPITNDNIVEGDETFTVTLSADPDTPLPDGVTISNENGTATGTITEDDTAEVTLRPSTVAEAEDGTFTYTVSLSAAADEAVTVRWTATAESGDTATVDDDLQETTNTVTFAANDNADKTFTIRPVDDTDDEDNETFTVTLGPDGDTPLPTGVTIGTGNSSAATITDDDGTPENATVNIADRTVAEDAGAIGFTVSLSRAVDSDVTLAVAYTAGSAEPGTDLGTPLLTTVTISEGETSTTLSVPVIDDDIAEDAETFTVTLSADPATPLPDDVDIGNGVATGTITDNDEAPGLTTSITIADADPVTEGAGPARFTVSLSQALTSVAILDVAYAPGTATNGTQPATPEEDLGSNRPTTVSIPAGRRSVILEVPITDDGVGEGRETFTVTLSAAAEQPDAPSDTPGIGRPPAFVLLFPRATATGTITDNDGTPSLMGDAMVNIADADPVAEGAGPARFTVSLSRAVDSDVVLDIAYATAGSAALADLGRPRPATVTIKTGATEATLDVPIFDDDIIEGAETFTVTLTVNTAPDGVAIADGVATGTIAATAEPSVLIEPRRIGAGTALRRHVGRFDTMTGTVVRNRLRGSAMKTLTMSETLGSGAAAAGGQLGKTRWGSWIDGSYAGFGGKATGRQADVYGGVDYLGGNGKWLIGALAGHEMADLEIGKATYSASYTHLGLYGGVRLSDQLVFDGALTYGMATPEVAQGDVSASYDANRITARIALTGDFGLIQGLGIGPVRVEPQVGLLYSREALGGFTDNVGRVAEGETLELGRFSFGPRLTWDFDWGQVVGGTRVQWDFLQIDDGVDGRLSGAADIGLRFDIAPGVTLGVHGDVDGIGISDSFGSLGGRVQLGVRF